jgi:hypothetical protein
MSRRPAPKTWEELESGVLDWLDKQWGQARKCPYCNNPRWSVAPVVSLSKMPGWPDKGGGPFGVFPVVQVKCTQCGQVVLLNALWIFEPQKPLAPSSQ